MKFKSLNKIAILAGCVSMGLLQSCENSLDRIQDWEEENPAIVSSNIKEVKAPEGFAFATTTEQEFNLSAVLPSGDGVSPNVGLEVYSMNSQGQFNLLAKGATDAAGTWQPRFTIPTYIDSLIVKVTSAGYPEWHKVAVGNLTTSYVVGAENDNGQVSNGPIPTTSDDLDLDGLNNGALGARSTYQYLGEIDRDGVPQYLTSDGNVDEGVLDFISTNLPGTPDLSISHPHYFEVEDASNIVFKEDGELWITFVQDATSRVTWLNSMGYFTYDPNNPPTSVDEIDVQTIVFPNLRFAPRGNLETGNRVYLGKFEAGTGVGWFFVPHGWNAGKGTVRDRTSIRYSFDKFNDHNALDHQRQLMLLLANEREEYFVLGFEDRPRHLEDDDFDDAIVMVEAQPWSAVYANTPKVEDTNDQDGDGVADFNDIYPLDPLRAYTSFAPGQGNYGTIAFEDLWPRTGDYDFNDLVVDYSFVEILDAKERVKDIELSLSVRAMGASQNHGFAMRLPIDPQLVESVTGQVLTDDYIRVQGNGTETGMREAIIPMFTDGFALFGDVQRGGIVNTNPELPELNPGKLEVTITLREAIDKDRLGNAPYSPFMLRSQDRTREIHLAGDHPTESADMEAFNTEADASDLEKGFFYVDKNNLPWAIHVPESFIYPQERVPINKVYENFADWATFGGESSRGWYQNTSANVNSNNGF